MRQKARLSKVLFLLVTAMTAGALVLLALEGKPIQPMPFSLSSQARISPAETAFKTENAILPGQWRRIDISYRANQGLIQSQSDLAGELALIYHFVIPDRDEGRNPPIYTTQRWSKQLACLDPPNGLYDSSTIKICLLTSNPDHPASTPGQLRKLQELVDLLIKHCNIEPNLIWLPEKP